MISDAKRTEYDEFEVTARRKEKAPGYLSGTTFLGWVRIARKEKGFTAPLFAGCVGARGRQGAPTSQK